ncbi:MAG: GIY-YIG nuclease family protein [Saprospiraceae bacterium]
MFFVYILYSESSDLFYVGHTSDIKNRLNRHNSGMENYTSKHLPWIVMCSIEKQTKSEAYQLELKIKNLSKVRIKTFIEKYKTISNADEIA